jgi:hypothetical protein
MSARVEFPVIGVAGPPVEGTVYRFLSPFPSTRVKTTSSPSGANAGWWSFPGSVTSGAWTPPVSVYRSEPVGLPGHSFSNARAPVGDQDGLDTKHAVSAVTAIWPVPSPFIVKIWGKPVRSLTNAIRPSEDHAGLASNPGAGVPVSCTGVPPAAGIL